jgi:hypothetical protein
MRFDLETEIRYSNGERAGILRRVALNADGHVDSVVMSTEGLITRDIIVPADSFSEAPGGVLQVNLSEEQLGDMPEFVEELEPMVPDGWEFGSDPIPGSDVFPATFYEPLMPVFESNNLPEGSLSFSEGTGVLCLDGPWGLVDEVLLGDDGTITSFVGRPDALDEHDRLIPIELVSEYGSDYITLNCNLEDLPTYTEELINDAEEPQAEP